MTVDTHPHLHTLASHTAVLLFLQVLSQIMADSGAYKLVIKTARK